MKGSYYIDNQVIKVPNKQIDKAILSKFQKITFKGDKSVGKDYIDYNNINGEYRFLQSKGNINKLELIGDILTKDNSFQTIPDSNKVFLAISNGFKLRGYQQRTHDYIVNGFLDKAFDETSYLGPNIRRLLLDLLPGSGKGFIVNSVIATLGLRPMILVKPTYVKKWVEELCEHYRIDKSEIFILNKLSQMYKLEELFDINNHKIVLLTTNLVTSAMKHDESIGVLVELTKHLKSDLLVNDESHQHFDSISNAIRLINPKFVIGMSASLVSNYSTEEQRQQNLFPDSNRLAFKVDNPFINYDVHSYYANNIKEDDYTGARGYSHNLYEETIMSNQETFREYSNMILMRLRTDFIRNPNYIKGDKCIIYFNSIKMIKKMGTMIQDKLTKANIDLKAGTYTGESEYEEMYDSDILIATHGKAGTAIDIPNLIYVLNTVNVSSFQLNIQVPGRLRKIKDRELVFKQLVAVNIHKHTKYSADYLRKFTKLYKKVRWINSDDKVTFFSSNRSRSKNSYNFKNRKQLVKKKQFRMW